MSGKNDDVAVVKRGRGRPKKEGERHDHAFRFNGSEEHMYMKQALESELNKNGGEIMREALELLYNMKIAWRR